MGSDQLRVPAAASAALVVDLAQYGARDLESGGFLPTSRARNDVSVVALLGEAGVTRQRGRFEVSAEVVEHLFEFADALDLQVRAQVHSHKHEAFMSSTDQRGNIRLPGFIASVVPNYCSPPPEPSHWGWWSFNGSVWTESEPAVTTNSDVQIIRVDSGGVRAD